MTDIPRPRLSDGLDENQILPVNQPVAILIANMAEAIARELAAWQLEYDRDERRHPELPPLPRHMSDQAGELARQGLISILVELVAFLTDKMQPPQKIRDYCIEVADHVVFLKDQRPSSDLLFSRAIDFAYREKLREGGVDLDAPGDNA